jgi:hypothetical protein
MEIKTPEDLIKKINELKEKVVDLSADEDLALAVMNLISMEEHLYFTAEKTGKDEHFDLLNQVREIRKKMMERLIGKPEGELWCFVKHTLSATMRLIEVGTKLQNQNKKDEAKEIFDLAYELFNIFWGIKLNIIPTDQFGFETDKFGFGTDQFGFETDKFGFETDKYGYKMNKNPHKSVPYPHKSVGPQESVPNQRKSAWLKNLIEKIIDCCKE